MRTLEKPARLDGGILGERFERNRRKLFDRIDTRALGRVFAVEHEEGNADPEFAGKYIDTAVALWRGTGRADYRKRAGVVVASILRHQRADGYLGTYRVGLEFRSFSVWNQQFAIRGLLAYTRATGDARALEAACRCADFLLRKFTSPGGPDLLDAGNQGIQHSCILVDLVHLHAATGRREYLDFCNFIVNRWERSNLRLVSSADRWFSIGCVKAAEMLICYQGLVELYGQTGKRRFLDAAAAYWDAIRRSQIGLTGGGSLAENWWMVGNRPVRLTNELLPNENCVAVSWMKLSGLLLGATGEARFADAFERTLYNHLLGSQAIDGRDFSYYQGLEGRKVHVTSRGSYACCRYRGMNLLARLGEHVVYASPAGPVVALYAASRACVTTDAGETEIIQETDYPRSGRVRIFVRPQRDGRFELRLRKPAWAPTMRVRVNGRAVEATCGPDGFSRVSRRWRASGDRCDVDIAMPIELVRGRVDDRDCAAVRYGPLVLAADSRYGAAVDDIEIAPGRKLRLEALPAGRSPEPMVRFATRGRIAGKPAPVTLVDYACAGSFDPPRDRFRVWLPVLR